MSLEGSKDRLEELKQLLAAYSHQYYVLDDPTVEDSVYDGLLSELKQIEQKNPELITEDSPTQRVGGKLLGGFKRVKHTQRMLSLSDVFDEADIDSWIKRISKLIGQPSQLQFIGDIKKDGLACSLIYEDGFFVQAITRGDGFEGEDVTANVKTIYSVPLRLRTTKETKKFLVGRVEVRGEIVMDKKDFVKLNKEREAQGEPLFMNPRNTAAGTIRQLDPGLVAQRRLRFLAYDLIVSNPESIKSFDQAFLALSEMGFIGPEYVEVLDGADDIHAYAKKWEKKREDLPYQLDGLVIRVNNRALFSELGIVGKNPRGAIAYKYPPEQSTTKIKDIFLSIGRTGAATPVAVLDPVRIAGSTVQMATLHNDSEIARKDVRVGDTIVVHKAGDIIPEIVSVVTELRPKSSQKFKMPKKCPECGTDLVKEKTTDIAWRCSNLQCPARIQNQIQHFASRGALDIEGLGQKNVEALLESGLIKDPADLYGLKKEQLLGLDRFAELSAKNLIEAINSKRNPSLPRFIFGLGIRHVGTQTAVDLANYFRTLESLSKASFDELIKIDGIGEVVAESLVVWFSEKKNKSLLESFERNGVKPQAVESVGGSLQGQSFVVTGTLESMDRQQASEKIRQLGGTFQSSIGKETTYLVVGKNVGASKLNKAKKIGVNQIGEEEFLKILSDK